MTPNQRAWAASRDRLMAAVTSLGFPGELADLLVRQLKSPKAIDRMTAYLYQARPRSMEMIVDEMLAICADAAAWKEKIISREAQEKYSTWLNSEERWNSMDEDE